MHKDTQVKTLSDQEKTEVPPSPRLGVHLTPKLGPNDVRQANQAAILTSNGDHRLAGLQKANLLASKYKYPARHICNYLVGLMSSNPCHIL